jgi:hypothetical protein
VQVAAWLVLVHVKNIAWFEGPGGQRSWVWAAWWLEQQDEVMDNFLVEPQNQGRAGTTWEPSHEWRLTEATPSSRGFRWFTRKPLGSLVDPQIQDRRTEDGVVAAPDRSDRWAWPVRPVGSSLTGVPRCSTETSKQRTRVRIARLASRLSKFAVAGHPSDGEMTKIFEFALERYVSLFS